VTHTPGGPEATRNFVVCGDTPLAYRLIDQLVTLYEARVTAIFTGPRTSWAERIAQTSGVSVLDAERLDTETFQRAGLADADALALVDQDDAGNVDGALLAQEIRPDLRIVIRMSNLGLGERMTQLLNNCVTLSAAAIAAPAFVAAAVGDAYSAPIAVVDRTLATYRRGGDDRPDNAVCALAVLGPRGTEPETLPDDNDPRADFFLVPAKAPPPPRRRPKQSRVRLLPILFGRRLRLVLGVFAVLFAIGTVTLAWARGISVGEAAYSALITELSGNPVDNAAGVAKVAVIFLTLVSVVLIPAITAAVVDSLVQARLRLEAGGLFEATANHIVVVGLGHVGTRVIRSLHEQGVDVVGIERDPRARGVQAARDLGIPVIIGDASRNESLVAASVATARALVVVSTDDVTNLETALLARAAKPDLRVVLRLFDAEFADRVKRAFGIDISRSVSYLAAPAFAAAMLGRQVIATIPVRRRVLLIAELPVSANSALEHQPVAAVNRDHEVRLLAIRAGDQMLWRPSGGRPIRSTDKLIVVVTRTALTHLVTESTTPADADAPYRLLEPWGMPHTRAASAEGSGEHPPFGPADAGSTRPA
jgi:Trk K+ transport system NAD-binding subunit